MLVVAEKEDEKTKVKQILNNHGIDPIVIPSVVKNLFYALEIQKKKY